MDNDSLIKIIKGEKQFGSKEVRITEAKAGTVLVYGYKAERPGKKGTNLYDALPLIYLMQVKRNPRNGDVLFTGLNLHYLESIIQKGKIIFRLRTGFPLSGKQLILKTLHNYRQKNVVTPIYELKDAVVDAAIVKSAAMWEKI